MDKGKLNRFERRKLRTQKKLIDAAIELILEKGYQAVTIQDITDRADLGRATFYLHFKDKDELVWGFIDKALEDFFDRLQALRDESREQKPSLYYSILLNFKLLDQNRDLFRVILGDLGLAGVRRRAKRLMISDLEDGMRAGKFFKETDLPQTVLAQFVTGALHQLFQWWLEAPNAYSPEQMADMTLQMLKGLL
jgi:AcrR family transcriptional regulator